MHSDSEQRRPLLHRLVGEKACAGAYYAERTEAGVVEIPPDVRRL